MAERVLFLVFMHENKILVSTSKSAKTDILEVPSFSADASCEDLESFCRKLCREEFSLDKTSPMFLFKDSIKGKTDSKITIAHFYLIVVEKFQILKYSKESYIWKEVKDLQDEINAMKNAPKINFEV